MKGLIVTGDGKLRLAADVPMPEPDDYEVLTRTLACGICNGTDLKLIEGGLRGFTDYPAVLGHESVGEVIKVGKKVRNYQAGDRVLRTILKSSASYNSLWGSFAQYGYVNDYDARVEDGLEADIGTCTQQVIPGDIDPAEGTMIITLKEICSALHRLGLEKGMDVAVIGCGPVGLSMAALSKLMGARKVVLGGHHSKRIEAARRLGADLAVNSKETDLVSAIQSYVPEGVDLFVDCVGRTQIIDQGMQVVKETGKIGVYGIGMHTGDRIDWDKAPYNFQIHAVQWPIAREERKVHQEVLGYIQSGQLDLKDFVTHKLPLEEYQRGIELVRSREGLKVVLEF
ncbi:zinc-dependent alcohol dehydrogenase [Luxibacter massiliensis]|uniref:zinc-dependent alcohol dehydrogenase n=1 Tax=Luxibacter massiliensis TaxID=2219695 RepID=UPI000F0566FB|nr:zinc-binding dehydrogenase [Luxibacter massiliensis]